MFDCYVCVVVCAVVPVVGAVFGCERSGVGALGGVSNVGVAAFGVCAILCTVCLLLCYLCFLVGVGVRCLLVCG